MNENQSGRFTNIFGILAGFLIGSLAGAVTMLLLARTSSCPEDGEN